MRDDYWWCVYLISIAVIAGAFSSCASSEIYVQDCAKVQDNLYKCKKL